MPIFQSRLARVLHRNQLGTKAMMKFNSGGTVSGFIQLLSRFRRVPGIARHAMDVQRTHHVDASEPDDAGMHEYHYEYDIYRFRDGELCFTARSYVDQQGEAHFLGIEVRGKSRLMVDADLTQPLFLSALDYLHAQGKTDLRWLSGRGNGYETVPRAGDSGS